MIFGGCPKRQTGPKVVYVPTPPPAAKPAQSDQTIVVQAPAPPAPSEVNQKAPQPVAQEPEPVRHRRARRAEVKPPPEEPAAEVPALQSAISSGQASELQGQVIKLQEGIEKRILRLTREWLSPSQRETLQGARGFLQQSQKALEESDLQRAYNLAHKSDLLVVSIEQSP